MAILTVNREVALFLAVVVLALSWLSLCKATAEGGGGVVEGEGTQPSCVTKLLPCQAFLHTDTQPTAGCCLPLRQLISVDPKCLCTVFNDDELLKSFHITKEDAIGMAKRCNATVHVDNCKQFGVTTAPAPDRGVAGTPPSPASVPPSKETSSATACAFNGEKMAGVAAGALVIGWTYMTALVF